MTCHRLAFLAVLALTLAAGRALAEDVIVKTITPGHQPPAATQPGEPLRAGPPPISSPTAVVPRATDGSALTSGDPELDLAVDSMALTDEQRAKLTPLLESARKEADQADQAYFEALAEYDRQVAADPNAPGLNALLEKVRQADDVRKESISRRRSKLVADLSTTLTGEQAAALNTWLEEQDPKSPAHARKVARDTLQACTHGMLLTAEQEAQTLDLILGRNAEANKRQEVFTAQQRELADRLAKDPKDAEARKQFAELQVRMQLAWQEDSVATRKAVEELLTPEQRKKLAEVNRKVAERYARMIADTERRSLARVKLTGEQRRKVDELVEAARQALSEIDPYEWQMRRQMSSQLRGDIRDLLTDEQKKLLPQ